MTCRKCAELKKALVVLYKEHHRVAVLTEAGVTPEFTEMLNTLVPKQWYAYVPSKGTIGPFPTEQRVLAESSRQNETRFKVRKVWYEEGEKDNVEEG